MVGVRGKSHKSDHTRYCCPRHRHEIMSGTGKIPHPGASVSVLREFREGGAGVQGKSGTVSWSDRGWEGGLGVGARSRHSARSLWWFESELLTRPSFAFFPAVHISNAPPSKSPRPLVPTSLRSPDGTFVPLPFTKQLCAMADPAGNKPDTLCSTPRSFFIICPAHALFSLANFSSLHFQKTL